MQAVILAAGMGKRLKELTNDNTKCMIKVNGITLIERMLRQLEKRHLSRIIIVVGYKGQKLINFIDELCIQTPIIYIENPNYDKTNNIYSLALAKEFLCQDDTLLFESDLIFEDSVIDELLDDSRDTLALVDKYENWMDGTCMKLGEDDSIEAFISSKKFNYSEINSYFKTVNIYKFSRNFSEFCYIPFLEAYLMALGNNEYYEQVLKVITVLDEPKIRAKRLQGQLWYEIDDIQDLDIAESLFATDTKDKVSLIQKRYGGYWRYPQIIDFCYLVNPYFPPQKLVDEIEANFKRLVSQYPSGMEVNALLSARNFGIHKENVLTGNGAAELIRLLMEQLSGKTGFIRPTFEEYPNRYDIEESIFFMPQNRDFSYTACDLINYFADKDINNLVLVNPDNPSGNYLCKKEILQVIDWTRQNEICFILDESFVDFAEEEDNTMIKQEILDKNPHLCIIKSISKSYGIPGLRLGVLVSGDLMLVNRLKKNIAIWNINSFAEFYMQIEQKYKEYYVNALKKLKEERKRFYNGLKQIEGIRPILSQANYIMAELTGSVSTTKLTANLLIKHNLFIKDLSSKIKKGQYVRFAVRNMEDNDKLLIALNKELGEK